MQTIFLKTSSETLLSLISAIETKQDIFLYMVLSYDNTVYNRAKARSWHLAFALFCLFKLIV